MASLRESENRFKIRFNVIEGGRGAFSGVLWDLPPTHGPSGALSLPKRLIRVSPTCPLTAGAVVRSQGGQVFLIGENGSSEIGVESVIWREYRAIGATGQYAQQRRRQSLEPVTGILQDTGGVDDIATIWAAIDPSEQAIDGQTRGNVESYHFTAAAEVQRGDVLNGKRVSKVDRLLGLYAGLLT